MRKNVSFFHGHICNIIFLNMNKKYFVKINEGETFWRVYQLSTMPNNESRIPTQMKSNNIATQTTELTRLRWSGRSSLPQNKMNIIYLKIVRWLAYKCTCKGNVMSNPIEAIMHAC
jgi:hypothetical protein